MQSRGGATSLELRKALAAKAYARTAAYDAAISGWFAREIGDETPTWQTFGGQLVQRLRYGENPHQWAAFYRTSERRPGVATAVQHQGKELSYNNLNDTDAAFELVAEFDPAECAAVAIIKHANPCGVACAASLKEAYLAALRCDPVSAFGGIIALNRTIDAEAAEEITEFSPRSSSRRMRRPKQGDFRGQEEPSATDDRRASRSAGFRYHVPFPCRRLPGAVARRASVDDMELKVVTKRSATAAGAGRPQVRVQVAKHVKSNAIVYAKDGATVGIGAGQ